jgi:hypothetical protein
MVGKETPDVPVDSVDSIHHRNMLIGGLHRQGKDAAGWPTLCAVLLAEVGALQSERDALRDRVELLAEDLAWELNAARTGPAAGTSRGGK